MKKCHKKLLAIKIKHLETENYSLTHDLQKFNLNHK